MKIFKLILMLLISIGFAMAVLAKTYYVDGNYGRIRNTGTFAAPFKTIQQAARILIAGDTCYVRGAIYRELVQFVNSGTSESKRIVYKAYRGETPIVCGSERVTAWINEGGNVYKARISNNLFGINNPFSTNLYDPNGWLLYGANYHLGAVYINGESYSEKLNKADLMGNYKSFYTTVSNLTTTIWINYAGGSNPNTDTSEISVRPMVIKPTYRGKCNYITLDGLTIRHGSTNWSSNEGVFSGMIDINAGGWWTIENCHISDGRTCGVQAGMSTGHHIVRNNIIERFGQAGLVGNNGGWFASLVQDNIFQDINIKHEFGGAETAAFKSHNTVDLTIKNNIFRRINVYDSAWGFAIWLDWRTQGNRITGNIFSDLKTTAAIEIECSHGPTLIDNNIFVLSTDSAIAIKHNSSNTIIAHNLFINGTNGHYTTNVNYIEWYKPHTMSTSGGDSVGIVNDKMYNNIFIGSNNQIPYRPGYLCNNNSYLQRAKQSVWGDANSHVNIKYNANVDVQNNENSTEVSFYVDDGTSSLICPLISNAFIGICAPTIQGMEYHDGSPVSINIDIEGKSRNGSNPKVGPMENLHSGINRIMLIAGKGN